MEKAKIVEETEKGLEQIELLFDALARAVSNASNVKRRVFVKVVSDISAFIDREAEKLRGYAEDALPSALAELEKSKEELTARLEALEEELEEMQFRKALGLDSIEELAPKALPDSTQKEKEEICQQLNRVDEEIEKLQGLLEKIKVCLVKKEELEKMPEIAEALTGAEPAGQEELERKERTDQTEQGQLEPTTFLNINPEEMDAYKEMELSFPGIVIVEGPEADKQFYFLNVVTTIGRSPSADIVLTDPKVSRKHGEFELAPKGKLVYRDLGSSNGSYLNEKRITEAQLKDGDILRLGDTIMVVKIPGGKR